jgi:hypothetical protein
MPIRKTTGPGQSYWKGTGAYQKEYEELYSRLVPSYGSAPTLNGELIRAISVLYHEFFENGNMNANTGNRSVAPFFQKFLNLIKSTVPGSLDVVNEIKDAIVNQYDLNDPFANRTISAYNKLADIVIHYVLTHDDQLLPRDYKRD